MLWEQAVVGLILDIRYSILDTRYPIFDIRFKKDLANVVSLQKVIEELFDLVKEDWLCRAPLRFGFR